MEGGDSSNVYTAWSRCVSTLVQHRIPPYLSNRCIDHLPYYRSQHLTFYVGVSIKGDAKTETNPADDVTRGTTLEQVATAAEPHEAPTDETHTAGKMASLAAGEVLSLAADEVM